MDTKFVYSFEEGNATMREILGGKGANLAEMKHMGLPVPDGFTITTQACAKYYESCQQLPQSIISQIEEYMIKLERSSQKKFADSENPLLVSVRSGARVSMPGMMDTILNLGLNDAVVEGLAKKTKNRRFALDSYRRFIQMFSNVVMGMAIKDFEDIIERVKKSKGVRLDFELDEDDLENIIEQFKKY